MTDSGVIDDTEQRPQSIHLMLLAGCLAVGLVIGSMVTVLWLWLMASAIAVLVSCYLRFRTHPSAMQVMFLATLCFGAAWFNYKTAYVAGDDLAAMIGDESVLVRIEGIATGAPEFRRRTGGSLAMFDYRSPSTYFPMRVDDVLDEHGLSTGIRGRVFVKVDAAMEPFRPGDRVALSGFLVPMHPPRNPGEFDRQAYARALGQAGMVVVPDRRLVKVEPKQRWGVYETWLDLRDSIRRRASGQLLSDLPQGTTNHREGLLKALLLGQREPDLDGLDESFRRVGLAHLMAISGLHLGILAGLVLLVARVQGHYRPWHGWLVIAVVLTYLTLIEVRLPVARAGIMTIVACAGIALGRYFHVGGLIALSGIGLLLWRPDQIFAPGFQLSFGVVLGLIYLQPPVRHRWFGKPNLEVASSAQMAGQWLISAFVTAVVAWLIATPIVIYHFGLVSPFGIVLSVIGVPAIALILAFGYAKIVLAVFVPSVGLLLGVPLAITTDALIAMVLAIDSLPFASWHVPFTSVTWTMTALAVVILWARGLHARITVVATVALIAWLIWPMLPLREQPALRIDMISVGDGTCLVMRSGGKTFVFDAGSNSSMDAGRRWIVPALRRLNVRTIDVIAISHPDIDHYSAVLELVDEFNVNRVLVTPQFIEHVRANPDGPASHVADGLVQRRIISETVTAGHQEQLGDARLQWHYPLSGGERFRRDNEQSMVVRVSAAGRHVLLCGDLEGAGMAQLMPQVTALRCDILELPHHGSYSESAAQFVRGVSPQVVLQSTGFSRWQADRWADELQDVQRLITVRDGACWVTIGHDGAITTGHILD